MSAKMTMGPNGLLITVSFHMVCDKMYCESKAESEPVLKLSTLRRKSQVASCKEALLEDSFVTAVSVDDSVKRGSWSFERQLGSCSTASLLFWRDDWKRTAVNRLLGGALVDLLLMVKDEMNRGWSRLMKMKLGEVRCRVKRSMAKIMKESFRIGCMAFPKY